MRTVLMMLVMALGVPSLVAGPLEAEVGLRARAVTLAATESGDLETAERELRSLRDLAVAYAPEMDPGAITVATSLLLCAQYAIESGGDGPAVFAALTEHPRFASHLVYAWDKSLDDEAEGGRLLVRLAEKRGEHVDAYPALAAAVVLVHDVPGRLARRVNENTATGDDPVAIFDYFVANERRLSVSPKTLPVELLMHVVDTTSRVEELEWALGRYGRRPEPGKRFFEIEYDYDHYYKGVEKKVTASGRFDLRAIKELGGVCADQAYFAEEVGKACGIPTAYVRAKGAEVSHAWIGFLEVRGRRASWNLDSGRYEAYQNLRGSVGLLGSKGRIDDSTLSLLAGLVGEPDEDRWASAAVAKAVWSWTQRRSVSVPERPEARDARGKPRSADDVGEMLALLREGVGRAPNLNDGWVIAANLARQGRLSLDQLNEWGTALDRLCGREYADFSVGILGLMIEGIERPEDKMAMWEWVHGRFGKRPDLAARCRLTQAQLAAAQGDNDRAWWAVMDVIERYGGRTPDVVDAATMAKRLLERNGKRGEVPAMLERAWGKIPKPGRMAGEFRTQSNWFRVGKMYADSLKSSDPGRAAEVMKELTS